ncbi:MAG: hypothetical protein ACPG06_04700 [Alphaproteobacteria bacterium]
MSNKAEDDTGEITLRPELSPIFDLFVTLIREPRTMAMFANWEDGLRKGVLNFGRKEPLEQGLTFNLLVYQSLNPKLDAGGRRIVLDPDVEIAGVISRDDVVHKNFNHMVNELLIIKARGKWDYGRNDRFRLLKVSEDLTLCLPKHADGAVPPEMADEVIQSAGAACAQWMRNLQITSKVTGGSA